MAWRARRPAHLERAAEANGGSDPLQAGAHLQEGAAGRPRRELPEQAQKENRRDEPAQNTEDRSRTRRLAGEEQHEAAEDRETDRVRDGPLAAGGRRANDEGLDVLVIEAAISLDGEARADEQQVILARPELLDADDGAALAREFAIGHRGQGTR
jgi:hypothetical protein